MRAPVYGIERPRWRGRLHALAALVSIPAGVLLLVRAEGSAAHVAAALYGAALLIMFSASAAYHHTPVRARWRPGMQRLDHCGIYVLIAGTYVPLCLLALPWRWGIPMLCVVGSSAVAGIVLKLAAYHRSTNIGHVLYLAMGWVVVVAAPVLVDRLSTTQLVLFGLGGLVYTLGFPVLITRWPNPWPRTFGYHEIWHGCTVAAAALHFVGVASLIR